MNEDTPRSNSQIGIEGSGNEFSVYVEFARQLERELTALENSILHLSHPNLKMLVSLNNELRRELDKSRSENLTVRAVAGDKYPDALLLKEVYELRAELEKERQWQNEDPRMLREQIRVADVAFNALHKRQQETQAELEKVRGELSKLKNETPHQP